MVQILLYMKKRRIETDNSSIRVAKKWEIRNTTKHLQVVNKIGEKVEKNKTLGQVQ